MADSFYGLYAQSMQLYGARRFGEALELLEREGGQFPADAPTILYLCSCLAARINQPERAESILADALDRGFWYSEAMMRESPSWIPLQGRPEFERLAAISIARAHSIPTEPQRFVAEPAGGFVPGQTYPLLIALHGNGDNGPASLRGWLPVTGMGWLLVALQSSQAQMNDTYVWDNQELALKEVAQHYQEIVALYPIDPARVVVVGFSMGGETTLRLSLKGLIPQRGFILLGPGGPTVDDPAEFTPEIEQRAPRDLRGYVLLGDVDGAIAPQEVRTLVGNLNAHGIPCQVEDLPGHHHEYPRDEGASLRRALDFILR